MIRFGKSIRHKWVNKAEKLPRTLEQFREAPWPSGRASDSGARGRGFDPHSGRRVVSLSKIHLPPKKYW